MRQFFKNAAGTPSAPPAEWDLSSEHASIISSSVNNISSRASLSPVGEKWCSTSETNHSGLGGLKTESYCRLKASAANVELGLGFPVAGSIKGPTLAFVSCRDFAKLKKDFG